PDERSDIRVMLLRERSRISPRLRGCHLRILFARESSDYKSASMLKKLFFGCFAFAVLAFMILQSPACKLRDFDQIFYVTVAYDLGKRGGLSNGILAADDDSPTARPPPGMFFGPVYPALVFVAMKIDPRFAAAVRCSVEADRGYRDEASCEAYALPMRLINAF